MSTEASLRSGCLKDPRKPGRKCQLSWATTGALKQVLTRNVGEFYQGHRVIWEKSLPVLGTPSHYLKNLRMTSNRNSRTILLAFERTAPWWARCKPWQLPGGGEKETKPCHVSRPQAARTAMGESGSSRYQRRACLGSGQHPKNRPPPKAKVSYIFP